MNDPRVAIIRISELRSAAESLGRARTRAKKLPDRATEDAAIQIRQATRKLFRLVVGRHPTFKELQQMTEE